MVTDTFVREAPSAREFLAIKLAGFFAKRASKRVAIARTWVQSLITTALHLAGFSSLTYSAFLWDKVAGFVVLGVCCFILSKLIAAPTTVDEFNNRPNLRGR
jgi:hypothetical protein